MSYCVNCGVELAETEIYCPLCGTEVINPKAPAHEHHRHLYANVPVAGYKGGYRDIVLPLTLLLLIPVLITLVCDWLTSGTLSWSVYVAASIGLAFVFILPPLALRKPRVLICMTLDWVALAIFLYVLALLTDPYWFLPIALPLVVIFGLISICLAALFKYVDLRKLVRFALILFAAGLQAVCIDLFISAETGSENVIGWSLYVLVPCVLVGLAALLVNRNHRLKENLKQRFFI